MRELKPVWKTSSFLVYLGGLTVLMGGISAVGYLSTQYGGGARTAWALMMSGKTCRAARYAAA